MNHLGSPASPCDQLQKEEVRPHQPAATQEEAQVDVVLTIEWIVVGRVGAWSIPQPAEPVQLYSTMASWCYI